MEWKITDDRPIWMQLSEQLAAQIAAGAYEPGERLPSVREFAAQAGVNPNTMQRALYSSLLSFIGKKKSLDLCIKLKK